MKTKSLGPHRRRSRTAPKPVDTGRTSPTSPSRSSWLAVGAVLASAALHGATATPAAAATAPVRPKTAGAGLAWTRGPAHEPLTSPPWPEFGQATQDGSFTFSIAPGELAAVLADFSRVTGVEVSLSIEALGTLQSPGVTGRFSAQQALGRLLTGTGVIAEFADSTHATISLATRSEAVDVVASTGVVSSPKYVVPVRDIPQTI
ncbi:MAG: STN domain-containing protein, partial [Vicinamibacterales bacterium]